MKNSHQLISSDTEKLGEERKRGKEGGDPGGRRRKMGECGGELKTTGERKGGEE